MVKRVKLGLIFGETLSSGHGKARGALDPIPVEEEELKSARVVYLFGIFILGFLALTARLIYLSVLKNDMYRALSDQNRIRQEVIRAPRSPIFDRNGTSLTENVPNYRLEIRSASGQVVGFQTIRQDEALSRQARGLPVITDPSRTYPFSEVFAHVLGFVNEIGPQQLENSNGTFEPGDLIGQGGLEQYYDALLRGRNGRRIYETDTSGKIVRILGEEQPIPGIDLHTSLDIRLQQTAASALGDKDGSAIVMEASTGAVLALVSSPKFNPNIFTSAGTASQSAISQTLSSLNAPLLNRAIGGAYPAGSTFKLAVATAALSEKKISPSYVFDDPGVITAGTQHFYNWAFSEGGKTEGLINTSRAITRSTDTFFYTIGALTGPDLMAAWAKKFGLGQTTDIDLPGEIPGLIPTPAWKQKTKHEPWYLGNTYNMSIGQGDVLVTPLQVAQMTQVVANDGRLCTPRITTAGKPRCHDLGISHEILNIVKNGMIGACSPGGTAFPLFDFKPPVACKSGTAQFGIEGKLTHAWLTAYAPADKPLIVVTVLVEGGGEGSAVAAPLVKDILNVYFGKLPKSTIATPSATPVRR